MRTVVLGLGNDLMSDDGIGLLVVRKLAADQSGHFDFVESDLCGLALLDLLVGYERAIIIDAMHTAKYAPGTVVELGPESLSKTMSPSPHYAGLPELIRLAEELGIEFPTDIIVFGIEAGNLRTIGGDLTLPVENALSQVVKRIRMHLATRERGGTVA